MGRLQRVFPLCPGFFTSDLGGETNWNKQNQAKVEIHVAGDPQCLFQSNRVVLRWSEGADIYENCGVPQYRHGVPSRTTVYPVSFSFIEFRP